MTDKTPHYSKIGTTKLNKPNCPRNITACHVWWRRWCPQSKSEVCQLKRPTKQIVNKKTNLTKQFRIERKCSAIPVDRNHRTEGCLRTLHRDGSQARYYHHRVGNWVPLPRPRQSCISRPNWEHLYSLSCLTNRREKRWGHEIRTGFKQVDDKAYTYHEGFLPSYLSTRNHRPT